MDNGCKCLTSKYNRNIYEESMNDLYEMKMHDIKAPDVNGGMTISILRVPGGWIYTTYMKTMGGYIPSSVFVPYDSEFRNQPYNRGQEDESTTD